MLLMRTAARNDLRCTFGGVEGCPKRLTSAVVAKRERDFLTPRDAADLIGKSPDWMKRARKGQNNSGGPPWYRIGGRIVYDRADVLEWLESRFCK
jgi:hypothetical protein